MLPAKDNHMMDTNAENWYSVLETAYSLLKAAIGGLTNCSMHHLIWIDVVAVRLARQVHSHVP
jgi:hypothetical protein